MPNRKEILSTLEMPSSPADVQDDSVPDVPGVEVEFVIDPVTGKKTRRKKTKKTASSDDFEQATPPTPVAGTN